MHDLAQAQRQAGYDVDVLTMTRRRGIEPAQASRSLFRPDDDAGLLAKARFLLEQRHRGLRDGYDVVHAHCSTMSPLAFATLGAARVPTAITVHSLWRRYEPLYGAGDLAVGWSKWPIAWSAVSDAAAQAVQRAAHRPLTVDIVPNGIDPSAWAGMTHRRDPSRLRVLSVMRLAPRKRPLALLRLLRAAASSMPPGVSLDAVVVGDGPQANAMRRYIRRHDMQDLVTLDGHLSRPEIARRLAWADVFVAPSTLESFGIAALEAAAAGVPVLGRRGTGLSEFVSEGSGGLLVDSDRELSTALTRMAAGAISLRPASSATLATFGWPSVLARTDALYARAGLRRADLATAGPGRAAS